MSNAIKIRPKHPRTKFVALDLYDPSKIIAEGTTPEVVVKRARKTGKEFSIMFIPKPGNYVF